ncbi:MAG: type II toxin-antitoxin system VapC family toxin [Acidobacteriota bacterium]
MSETNWQIYFDASALAKRYAPESGGALVDEVFRLVPAERFNCLLLGVLEVVSILIRKRNDGRLDAAHFNQAILNFNAEVIESDDFLTISADDSQIYAAIPLLHAHNINGTDAMVLHTAIELRTNLKQRGEDLMLWTSDKRLARAAMAEGLTVFNPEIDSIARLQQLLGVSASNPAQE